MSARFRHSHSDSSRRSLLESAVLIHNAKNCPLPYKFIGRKAKLARCAQASADSELDPMVSQSRHEHELDEYAALDRPGDDERGGGGTRLWAAWMLRSEGSRTLRQIHGALVLRGCELFRAGHRATSEVEEAVSQYNKRRTETERTGRRRRETGNKEWKKRERVRSVSLDNNQLRRCGKRWQGSVREPWREPRAWRYLVEKEKIENFRKISTESPSFAIDAVLCIVVHSLFLPRSPPPQWFLEDSYLSV